MYVANCHRIAMCVRVCVRVCVCVCVHVHACEFVCVIYVPSSLILSFCAPDLVVIVDVLFFDTI